MKGDGEKFAETFSSFVNSGMREDIQEATAKMLRDHPTLQQGMMRFCITFIEEMSGQRFVDGRNKASVELAQEICNKVPERSLPRI